MSSASNPAGSLSLKGRLQFLVRDTWLYGGASAVSKAFALITFPLLARHMTAEEYGTLDYFLVLSGFFTILFVFGQDSAIARYFYEHEEVGTRQQLISQSLVFQFSGLVLCLPLLWVGSEWLSGILIAAPDGTSLLKIILLQLPFLLLINFSQNLLRWTFARGRFLTMSLGYVALQASLLVLAVLVFDVGIAGVLLVSLATSIFFGVLGLFFIHKWLALPRDFNRIREMFPFAIPWGIIAVVGAFLPTLERALTSNLLGAEALGLYAVGAKLAMLIGMLASAFHSAWGPFSLSLYKQPAAALTFNWALKLYAFAACIAGLLLTLLAQPLIVLLATDRYLGAVVVVFPLAMGLVIQTTSWVTEIGIGISKRSQLNLYAYGAAVTVTLGGILVFTPNFGLLGVALGVLSGNITKSVTASYLAQQAYPLPWQYGPVVFLMAVTLAGGLASTAIGIYLGTWIGELLLVAVMFLVIILGWYALFSKIERTRVKALLMQRWSAV